MIETLKTSEVIEAMVEYVRANLKLRDRKETGSNQCLTFTGRGVTESEQDVKFVLEVVINIKNKDEAARIDFFQRRVKERSSPHHIKGRRFTGIIFPKSIDYASAKRKFYCPYFRQANLLQTISDEIGLLEMYKEFNYNDVKDLSRVEWSFAMSLAGSQIAYYNPIKDRINIHNFTRFPCNQVIPDNRPIDQGYFWDYMRVGEFPGVEGPIKKADTFRGIQQGLHDRVRKMVKTISISGEFSLSKWGSKGAKIIHYEGTTN